MARHLPRAVRISLYVLGGIVALPVAVVALVLLALAIPPLRAFAVSKGLDYANANFLEGYTAKVKSVDRLDPWGVNIRGTQLLDDQQREIVSVRWVMVRLDPFALLGNTLALKVVHVDDVRAHLYPSEPKPEEPEEPPSEPSTFTIRADAVRIRGVAATTEWSGRTLRAMVGTLAAGGQYGPKPALAIREASVRVTADDDELLRLRTTEGAWRAETGGRVGIEAMVAGAPLTLRADLPPLDQVEPWPLRNASLRIRDVRRSTLAKLGVTDGAELHVPVSLALDAHAQGERLEARVKLRAGKAAVDLTARADDKAYDLSVDIAPARLAAIAGILPDMRVEGDLHVRATPTGKTPEKVQLEWSNVAIDDGAVPAGILRAELPLPIVRLSSLTLAGLEQALEVRGEYDTDRGNARAELELRDFRLDAIEALQKMGMAGTLNGGLSASFVKSQLNAKGALEARGFKHPSARVAELDLSFGVEGTALAPQGQLHLRATQLALGEHRIDQITSDATATLTKLSGRLQVSGPSTLLNAEIGGQRTAEGDLRAQAIGRGHVGKTDLRFDIRELLYGKGGVTVQEVALYSGKQSAWISGHLDAQNNVKAELKLGHVDLGYWAKLASVEDVAGILEGVIKVGGTTSEPRVDTNLSLRGARYKAKLPVNAQLALKADLGERRAETKFTMYSDEELGANLTASVAIPKRPADLNKAIEHARVSAELSAWMPIEQISAMAGDQLAGLGGMLEAKVKAEGTMDEPMLDADVTASLKLPEQEGDPVEAIRVAADVNKKEAKLGVWAKDELGELLTLDGFVEWPGGSPRAALETPQDWQNARFQTRASLSSRRFDTMQGVFAYFSKLYAVALPIRAAGSVSFEGNQGKLDGAVRLGLTIYGDKLDGRCKLGAESAVDLEAKLKHDQVEIDIDARTDHGGNIEGKLTSKLALNALTGEDPVIGPAKLTLDGKQVAIHELPGLCNLAGGTADFSLAAEGLGKQRPTLTFDTRIANLHAVEMEPIAIAAKARAGGNEAVLTASIESAKRPIGSIDARLPLVYPDGTTPTVLPDAPVKARLKLDKLPLANVLALTEALGRTSGTASADIDVSGKLNDPYPVGYFQLDDVNVSIAAIAQPLRDIDGRIEIKGRSVKIPKLTVRDRDGKIELQGFATLRKDLSGEAGVFLDANEFPLRQQGTIIGELTTRARLDVKIPESLKAEAQLKILEGSMWLTGERGKKVQNLDPHPDIRFSDEKLEQASTPTEQKAEGTGFGLGSFKMKTEQGLWLNHKDFSIQVGVDLAIKQGEDGPSLEGEATLIRGELQLLGKPFKLQRGAIRFAGPMPPDPELDIKAIYDTPSGQDLIVQVTGRGSAPVLEFSGAATTAGEAILVLQGRGPGGQSKSGADSQAAASMAGIAADMTAGLLIMTARREFGDWVPMISVDTGASGQPTSARAGFDASKLIPPWLQGFARSAYVEGIVGQRGQSGGGSVGVGVRLEVGLPRDFITTFGYGPTPGGWSADLAWSP